MAAGDVVGAREVLEDLAAREDMRGCLVAQTMLADLLDEIKAAANLPERSVASNPESASGGGGSDSSGSDSSGDSESSGDSDSDSSSDSESSSSEESDDAREALLQRLGDVPDAHAMAERHLAVLAIDPKRVASLLGLTRAFFEAQADEARALLHPDHVASQDAWREASRTKHATSRAVLEALCRWAEAAPAEAAPWRALTVAVTGLRWPSLDAHRKYGGGSVADPVTEEIRLRKEVVGVAEDVVHVFGGGGDGSSDTGRLATWRRSFIPNVEALKAPPDTTPEEIAALASRAAAFAALFRDDDVVDAFVNDAEAAVNKALARAHGSKRARRHPERTRGVCAFRARDVGSRAVVEEALLAAKREAVAAAARRRAETADDDGGDGVLEERGEEEGAGKEPEDFRAVSEWVDDRGLATQPARKKEPEKSSRVRTGGYKTKRVRLQELVDIRDGVVLRRGMKKRKGDPRRRAHPDGGGTRRDCAAAGSGRRGGTREGGETRREGGSPARVPRREAGVQTGDRVCGSGGGFGRAGVHKSREAPRASQRLARGAAGGAEGLEKRGGDLNGHDERTLLRLDRWRSNLTIARNRAVITGAGARSRRGWRTRCVTTRRTRTGLASAKRAGDANRSRASAPSTAAPTAPRTGAKTPRRRARFCRTGTARYQRTLFSTGSRRGCNRGAGSKGRRSAVVAAARSTVASRGAFGAPGAGTARARRRRAARGSPGRAAFARST